MASMFIPLAIFLIGASACGYWPFGENILNIYDSFTQYPGFLLEYKNLLSHGNIFYSWNAGLGFNFLGTFLYYAASPLNILCIFANPQNYPIYAAVMVYLRIALLGGSMCFYLDKRGTEFREIILFSTMYALMGFTSTYYYNYMWMDSVIMLPLVIYGIEKLIAKDAPLFYISTLTLAIIFNFYIGYMICLFSLIYYFYKVYVLHIKGTFRTFFTSSLLAGLISSLTLLPSFFALISGKSSGFSATNYFGISRNALTFFYTLTPGSYYNIDYTYGPAQVYATLGAFILASTFFSNKKIAGKEKVATLIVFGLFYLSFSFNLLNYAWQFFQKPIWWESRFSFTFSFFLILIALKSWENVEYLEIKKWFKMAVGSILTVLFAVGFLVKARVNPIADARPYLTLAFSMVLLAIYLVKIDKPKFKKTFIFLLFLELTINTYNGLKENIGAYKLSDYSERSGVVDTIGNEDDNFHRMEVMEPLTFQDGLFYGYHGLNYFNSTRNQKVIALLDKLGINILKNIRIDLKEYNPALLSLLGVSRIYENGEMKENAHPLALGFMGSEKILDISLDEDDDFDNLSKVYGALIDEELDLFEDGELNEDNYEYAVKILERELLNAKTYKNGHILEGQITVEKPGLLFTTIEYEEGMKIYVDDKKVEPKLIFDVLIGLPLDRGIHKIYIDYVPKGLIGGIALSFTGIVLSALYVIAKKKKNGD